MKAGQLTEYNMRNIFLEKSYTKCGGEASLRPFYKILQLVLSFFIAFPSRGPPKYIKTFLKNKKRSGSSLPTSFSVRFLKKNISHIIFY